MSPDAQEAYGMLCDLAVRVSDGKRIGGALAIIIKDAAAEARREAYTRAASLCDIKSPWHESHDTRGDAYDLGCHDCAEAIRAERDKEPTK